MQRQSTSNRLPSMGSRTPTSTSMTSLTLNLRSGRSSAADDVFTAGTTPASTDRDFHMLPKGGGSKRNLLRSDSRSNLNAPTSRMSTVERPTMAPKTGRPKFASMGKKVMTMMSFKRVFGGNRKDNYANDPFGMVRDLPPRPRFSATLSAEAQYAMMKGYEDLLVRYLKQYYPENALFLPRTKTPPTFNMKVVTTDKLEDVRESPNAEEDLKDKQIVPVLHRAKTEPARKQLVVTHRFQNAMDILDTVKKDKGYNVTSPRPLKQEITPIVYYKSWANHWGEEFKFVKSK